MENNTRTEVNKNGGPRSEAGKAISKYNAVRHSILTQNYLGDEHDETKVIREQFYKEYSPKSITEELLIENMVIATIRTERVHKEEVNIIAIMRTVDIPNGNLFVRYLTTSERQFYRALHELQRIQALRSGIKPSTVAIDFIGNERND